MSLNCIIAMSDRLLGREERPQQVTLSEQQEVTADTNSGETGSDFFVFLLLCVFNLCKL